MQRCFDSHAPSSLAFPSTAALRFRFGLLAFVVAGFLAPEGFSQESPATAVPADNLPSAKLLSDDDLAAVKQAEAARVAAVKRVYGSVVAIYGNDRGGGGSGVLIDPHGYAVTNHHVVAAAGVEGWAGLADGKLYRWRLLGSDPGGDVAIIQLLGRDDFPVSPLGNSNHVRVGQWAMAMGNPFVLAEDQRPTVTLGIVSGIERFQPGEGMNQLVYGNCIQVDSSINPGNSGGPLFNLLGEVIGINGRGSFQERGRVNVGLGYAISSNQVKLFVPDLLATKIAQHGTLDAIFGTREQGVICYTMNLDSPIAKKGLSLGDRILSLEGVSITDANQLTNLISIYPAGWPVTVVFEHEGKERSATVRLTPLPYEPIVKTPPPMPKDEEKKEEKEPKHAKESTPENKPACDEPDSEEKAEQQPADETPNPTPEPKEGEKQPPMPMPEAIQARPPAPIPLNQAGKPRSRDLAREVALLLVDRLRESASTSDSSEPFAAIRLSSEILDGEKVVGQETMLLTRDGRSRVTYTRGLITTTVSFDGAKYWLQTGSEPVREINFSRAFRDPHFASSLAMLTLVRTDRDPRFAKIEHEGSDKADGTLAHRLSITDDDTESFFLYLKVFDDSGRPTIGLLKSGVGIDDEEPIPSVVYRDIQPAGAVQLPRVRLLVQGLSEQLQVTIQTQSVDVLKEVEEGAFHVAP